MRVTASGSTTRRPTRSVSSPPTIEPRHRRRELTKKKTPIPASVWSKAGSIERISDGTRRPVQPTRSSPAQARAAAIRVRQEEGKAMARCYRAPWLRRPGDGRGRYRRAMPAKAPRRHAERRAVLRPRRQRDLGGAGRERGPHRGPGPGPWLGRDGRRARVAPPLRPPPRQLDEGDPPARPAVADAAADPARRDPQGRGDEDRHQLLRGPARGAVRRPRPAVDGRRHRLPRPPRLDPGASCARS